MRILPVWPPAVFTIPQAPGFEDSDPVGSNKNDERTGFVASCRVNRVTPHVFGCSKTVGRIRQAMYRGRERVKQLFLLTQAAYSLTCMHTLAGRAA